jgi:GNAT superfamily N-acetyltransferase
MTTALPPVQELFSWHVGAPRPPLVLPGGLPAGYRLELMHRYEEPLFTELIDATFFVATGSLRWRELGVVDDPSLRGFRTAGLATRPTLRIALRAGNALVGWSYGFADRVEGFYMASSAVLDGHRRKGLYTAMADAVLGLARQAGFHFVHSRHVCTNNPILLAKLGMGFHITGFELTPDMGSLVTLEKPLIEAREHALRARSGAVGLGAPLSELLR